MLALKIMKHQSMACPWDPPPWAPMGTQDHLSRLSDICCQRVWWKLSHLFKEVVPQGADPEDLLVSSILYRPFPKTFKESLERFMQYMQLFGQVE